MLKFVQTPHFTVELLLHYQLFTTVHRHWGPDAPHRHITEIGVDQYTYSSIVA